MTTMIVDSNQLRLGIPFSKIDKENRIVTGIATLDNMDSHGDVITAEASKAAFEAFRGNIREMHGSNPVGKLVSFREKQVPGDDGELYNAIEVDVYVSKAEPEVWTKITEGVFSGFSIGGSIKERSHHDDPDNKHGFKITSYDLFELSIVDNPANPMANVLAIQKSVDGVSGMVARTGILNIMRKGNIVLLSENESLDDFEYDGWIENTPEAIADVVEKYKDDDKIVGLSEKIDKLLENYISTDKGGVTVSKDITEETETTEEVAKAADIEEVEVEEVATEKSVDESKEILTALSEQIADLKDSFSKTVESAVDEAGETLKGDVDAIKTELSEQLEALTEKINDLGGRVDSIENSTATKKSADVRSDVVDDEDDRDTDDFWRGGFLGSANLLK